MEMERSCTFDELNFDEACVILKSNINLPNLWLYTLSSDCIKCPYSRAAMIESEIISMKVKSARSQYWRIIETDKHEEYIPAWDENGLYCQLSPNIGEFGIYELTVDYNNSYSFVANKQPVNSHLPLVIILGLIALFLCVLSILKIIFNCVKRCRSKDVQIETVESSSSKPRLRSLDTVRGMSILLMIFVNNGAGGYVFLEHATWNGLFVGDLVFPCFLWIMGVCIPLSISSQLTRGTSRFSICCAIVKRSFYLFFIGISLNTLGGKNQLESIRIFGVLQRFSVCYLVTAMIYLLLVSPCTHLGSKVVYEILILMPQWIIAFFILLAHCVIIFLLPVPDCPKGYLGPGGRHDAGKYWNCVGGAAGYVDKVLLGVNHIYQFPTANSVYGSGPFDPEGVLGCLTSIFQVFLGIQAGQILCHYEDWKNRIARWLVWALIFGVIGLSLHFTEIIPVNKNLWSVSFVMVTTSFSLGLLSACYFLVDVIGVWEGGPFRIPGMNALVMYIGHQVFYEMFPFHWRIGKMNTHSWLMAESLWCIVLWTCIAYTLHWKKLYVTL
ncbi:PREDICTED: heparan-alpha-glucosaminide N-acetyltransferase-like [Ceratosolen solmsi marchali]|uniref:Heparan-alpha-glucosaminide N-acetyltransferase-like n=1 Tax=Ceratosolen solmsi marchali TaxID=326594 RepID=A0AAJ7DYV7_9HYME|nr:PREDICTED: heparan-alpha-glucosaminide N-acetyltransferase-like [Ceratosolen solmsi marchali]